MSEAPGYQIAVSYTGLEAITAAINDVADAFGGGGGHLRGRELMGASSAATEVGNAVVNAASGALSRAADLANSLAQTLAETRGQYATNEQQITAAELPVDQAKAR